MTPEPTPLRMTPQFDPTMAVAQFMHRAGQPILARPELVGGALADMRAKLMHEEMAETVLAMQRSDIVGIADGLADLMYTVIGTALTYGIDLSSVFLQVHLANMRKFANGVQVDEDGKIQKPEGWEPPDIAGELRRQGAPFWLLPRCG